MRRRWAALAAVNVAAIIFGSTALFGKLAVSPFWIVAGRGAFAAMTLLALGLARRAPLHSANAFWLGAGATGALLALHWVTFFMAVQQAGVAVATQTFATFPLFTVVLDPASRREWPTAVELGSGAAIVLAVLLLVARGLPQTSVAAQGALAGLVSALCFALFSLGSQRLAARVHAIALSFYQNAVVALVLLPALLVVQPAPRGLDWAIIAVLGVVATALMHQLYFFALKHLPAAVCGGFVALEPVYAIVFAALLFSEAISPITALSGALIVGASFLLLSRAKTPSPALP